MEIIYVANDGVQFDNKEECIRYERFADANKIGRRLRFFNADRRELLCEDPLKNFEDCSYVFIADNEALEFLNAMTEKDYWCDKPTHCGLFYYDDNDEAFYNVDTKISDLKAEIAEYEKLVLRCNSGLPYFGES